MRKNAHEERARSERFDSRYVTEAAENTINAGLDTFPVLHAALDVGGGMYDSYRCHLCWRSIFKSLNIKWDEEVKVQNSSSRVQQRRSSSIWP